MIRRITKWVSLIAGALIVVVIVAGGFLLLTEAGGNLTIAMVNRSQDQIHIGELQGRLLGHFTLMDISVATATVRVDIDEAEMAWRPAPIVNRHLVVRHLRVDGALVVIETAPPDSTDAPADSSTGFSLPFDITAHDIDLRAISVDAPNGVHVRDVAAKASFDDERYDVDLNARIYAPVVDSANVQVQASGGFQDAEIDTLRAALWNGTVGLSGRASWSPEVTFTGRLDVDSVRTPWLERAVSAQSLMHGNLAERAVHLDTLHATVGTTSLRGSGHIDSTVSVVFDLDVPDLKSVAIVNMPVAGAVHLSGNARGTPHQFRLQVALEATDIAGVGKNIGAGTSVFDATIVADSSGIPARAEIHALNAHLRGIGVDASGGVRWRPSLAWDVALKADSISFSRMLPDSSTWFGTVSLDATTDGSLTNGVPRANIDMPSITGTINGEPLKGRIQGRVDGKKIDAHAFEISWGPLEVVGAGRVDDSIDMTLDLDVSDLSVVVPNAAGALSLKLKASGEPESPILNAEVTASGLEYEETAVGSLEATVDADLAHETGVVRANVRVGRIIAGGQSVDTLSVRADGNRAAHEITVYGAARDVALALTLAGGVTDDAWRGHVDSLRIAARDMEELTLEAPAPVVVSADHARIDTLCIASASSRACIAGSWARGDSAQAEIELARFDLAALMPLLPDSLGIAGTVSGLATASLRDSLIVASADFETDEGKLTYQLNGQTRRAEFGGSVNARADDSGVSASLDLEIIGNEGKATASGALTMDGYKLLTPTLPGQPVEATLDIDITSLSFVEAFARELDDVQGQLLVHVVAGGNLPHVSLTSRIDLSGGHVRVPGAGIAIHDITLRAEGDEQGRARLSGGATSGGGTLGLEGEFTASQGKWMSAEVKVTGNRFTVLNTPEMRVLVSPEFQARMDTSSVVVSGDLVVPVARIRLAEVPTSAVGPSRDVVYVGQEEQSRSPLNVSSDVRIVLGDSVSFHGFGFRGDLHGQVLAVQRRHKPTTGTGELTIRNGTYRVYNTRLTIDPGRVIFGGGRIDNPSLDVRAYRKTRDDVIAGVIVRGTVRKPALTVYSEPVMAQSDALSYLVLGHKASNDSGEGQMLGSAALSMGLAQGSAITQDIGGQIGLDEAGIESEGPLDEASFVAGKYLSPQLYVSYGVGLFDKQTTVRVRYLLTSRWTLQAESGRETSTDLLFRIERGE